MSLALLVSLALAADPDLQEVRVEVVTQTAHPDLRVTVTATWLGEERVLVLADDGSSPGDAPADGLFVGTWRGPPVRMLPLRIEVTGGQLSAAEVYSGIERLHPPADRLAFALSLGDNPRAQRVVAPYLVQVLDVRETSWVAASLGWLGLCFLYVAWLAGRAWPRAGA